MLSIKNVGKLLKLFVRDALESLYGVQPSKMGLQSKTRRKREQNAFILINLAAVPLCLTGNSFHMRPLDIQLMSLSLFVGCALAFGRNGKMSLVTTMEKIGFVAALSLCNENWGHWIRLLRCVQKPNENRPHEMP